MGTVHGDWVEAGITEGEGVGTYYAVPTFFRASTWYDGSYHETFYPSDTVSLNTLYPDAIHYQYGANGSAVYYVSIGPRAAYTSAQEAYPPNDLQAGFELAAPASSSYEYGVTDYLSWYDTSNTLYSQWDPTWTTISADPGLAIAWFTPYNSFGDGVNGCPGSSQTATSQARASSAVSVTPSVLATGAKRFAAANGESSPSSMKYVSSTRKAAVAVVSPGEEQDPGVSDTEAVYAVTITGHFIGHLSGTPKGHAPPTGTALSFLVDANTGAMTDWALTPTAPDLSQLGETHDLG